MANIGIAGGTGAVGGAIGGLPYAGATYGLSVLVGAVIGGVLGAGSAALSTYLGRASQPSNRKQADLVETKNIRNAVVAVVSGRGRLGGNWIEVGYFDQVKDFEANVPKGTIQYVVNAILALCEGPIQTWGNVRQDGQTLRHWLILKNLPWQYLQYNDHLGTNVEALWPAQSSAPNGFTVVTPHPVPFRNVAAYQMLTYTGPAMTTRLPDINVDVVGPEMTIKRSGTTTDPASGDVATDCHYDGYTESFYSTLSASTLSAAPFGLVGRGRRGGNRYHTAPPTGVGTVSKAWYLGRHDVLVMQDPVTPSTFYIGYWKISPTSTDWETVTPSPDYANAILSWCLDERHGILHTLHNDGAKRYILRWNLLTGVIDRTDTDLAAATFMAMTFSPDLGAYVVASSTNLLVVSSQGETIRSATNPSTAACKGVFVAGQKIGVISNGTSYYYDFYSGLVTGPFGSANTDTTIGGLGLLTSCRQNTWTGHITLCRQVSSAPLYLNFIASCVEDTRDINANGTSGTGPSPWTSPNPSGAPEPDFQNPVNLFTDTSHEPYHPLVYIHTGNVVGSTNYPPNDNQRDWIRDWSWRNDAAWNLVSLQGNSSLAGAMWNFLVSEPCNDSERWGAGLSDQFFSLSSFEAVHSYCVGPITVLNPTTQDTRVCERFKFDHVLDQEVDIASLVTQTILVCCQGFHYTVGGVLYVDVPRPGVWPMWHFSDSNVEDDNSFAVTFVSRADGVNRVRVLYRDVLDEYRHNYAEAEDLADIYARGRVQSVEINAEGCGRFDSAQMLAKQVLDQSTAGRRQVTFKTHFLGLMMTPSDVIEISNRMCALSKMPARVMVVREDAEGTSAGAVEIQCIEVQSTLDTIDEVPPGFSLPGNGVEQVDATTAIDVTAAPGNEDGAGKITWVANGASFPDGTYTIAYVAGAYKNNAAPYVVRGYRVVTKAGDGTINVRLGPPLTGASAGIGVAEPATPWATIAAAETANAGQNNTFTVISYLGSQIGIQAPLNSTNSPHGLDAPTGLTVTPAGTTGSTTYAYRVTSFDQNGNETDACAEVTTTTGNATLSSANYVVVAWTSVAGASSYGVYGRTSGGEQLLAYVSATTYNDDGSQTPSGAPPATNSSVCPGVTFAVSI